MSTERKQALKESSCWCVLGGKIGRYWTVHSLKGQRVDFLLSCRQWQVTGILSFRDEWDLSGCLAAKSRMDSSGKMTSVRDWRAYLSMEGEKEERGRQHSHQSWN